jgi:hypothetical protein
MGSRLEGMAVICVLPPERPIQESASMVFGSDRSGGIGRSFFLPPFSFAGRGDYLEE